MSILSGFFKTKKYRLTDSGYKLQSEWTSSETVEMNDGSTVEEKMVEKIDYTDIINSLTTAVAVTDTKTPVGCGVAKELNNKIVIINTALPYTIEIDDEAQTINFIDR